MKKLLTIILATAFITGSFSMLHAWGFWAHRKINHLAVFTLPDPLKSFYERHIDYVTEHAIDPDLRRNFNKAEGVRHYIDADKYGKNPFDDMPKNWADAAKKYSADTLMAYGINPWVVDSLMKQLTQAFRDYKVDMALALSADIGHYLGDANVPLHTTMNYDGQMTGQKGIHGLWEGKVPETYNADYKLHTAGARYIADPLQEAWNTLRLSFSEKDSVLNLEKGLSDTFPKDKKWVFITKEDGSKSKVYSDAFVSRYHYLLRGMEERKLRKSISDAGSFWYTAWVNAGQPDISGFDKTKLSDDAAKKLKEEEEKWGRN